MIQTDDLIKIGRIRKTFATKGEVVVETINDLFDDSQSEFLFVAINELFVPFYVEEYRYKGDESLILKFEDVSTEKQATSLIGADVYVEKSSLSEDNRQSADLLSVEGFEVIDQLAGSLGTIVDINNDTANLLITLSTNKLIPLHDDLLTDINYQTKQLFVCLPEGLLEL